MSGLQKRYYAKLYRIGKLKKKPYSQVWKYKEDIRKMHKLQEEYLFLVNHDIHSAEELVSIISSLTDKRKEVSAEKSRIYKARERSRELFDTADDMKELEPAEKSFLQGDEFFTDISQHKPNGKNVMLLGLDVLPQYRGQGLGCLLYTSPSPRDTR